MRRSLVLQFFASTLLLVAAGRADPPAQPVSKDLAERAKKLIEADPKSEAALMAKAILKGSQLGPGEGWFQTPAQSRYDWKWLAGRHGVAADKSIDAAAFRGSSELFALLDRDGDGRLDADDLDWSPRSSFLRQMQTAASIFRAADRNGDGRVTADEWNEFFRRGGGETFSQEGVRRALFPKPPAGAATRNDGPTPDVLLRGLFAGEIGSMKEGPKVGDPAPDFMLKTRDGSRTVHLKELLGRRPVVLVFGNFSCGPFRSWGATLSELQLKHKDRAEFLGVYVREAHPTDGWRMEQNDRVGVAFPQPTDYAGRQAAAQRCATTLQLGFPLLVDEIDDRTGNAYSGMPARLYVIDSAGRVAYKSARGPFGFRPAEMEQALAMTLLDESKPKATVVHDQYRVPATH